MSSMLLISILLQVVGRDAASDKGMPAEQRLSPKARAEEESGRERQAVAA